MPIDLASLPKSDAVIMNTDNVVITEPKARDAQVELRVNATYMRALAHGSDGWIFMFDFLLKKSKSLASDVSALDSSLDSFKSSKCMLILIIATVV